MEPTQTPHGRRARATRPLAGLLALGAALSACAVPLTLTPVGPTQVSRFGRVTQLFRVTFQRAPVPNLARERFTLQEDGAAVSPSEADARVDLRGQPFVHYTAVLLDVSGSMREHFPELRDAARGFVARLYEATSAPETQHVAVYAFSGGDAIYPLIADDAPDPFGGVRHRARFSSDARALNDAIETLGCEGATPGPYCADRSTNLNGAILAALRDLRTTEDEAARARPVFVAGTLVVFTDGSDRARRATRADVATALGRLRENEHVFAIGLGGEVDDAALREVGRDGYVPATAFVSLGAAFGEVASRLSDVANSYYLLRYCSPSRTGQPVRLTVTAHGSAHTGSLDLSFTPSTAGAQCQLDDGAPAPPGAGSATPPAGSATPPAAP